MAKCVILFDGMIGVGKTTGMMKIGQMFKEAGFRVLMLSEPIIDFTTLGDFNPLQCWANSLFTDPNYLYLFQIYVASCLVKRNMGDLINYDVILLDRNIDSCYMFIDAYTNILALEKQSCKREIMIHMTNLMKDMDPLPPTMFMYCDCPIPVALQRIKNRGRLEEEKTSIKLMEEHHKVLDEYFTKCKLPKLKLETEHFDDFLHIYFGQILKLMPDETLERYLSITEG